MTRGNRYISRRQFIKRGAIAAAVLAVAPQVIVSAQPDRIEDVAPNWYVDSLRGKDTNDGTAPTRAFASISQLLKQNIQAGQTIGLIVGSYWREMLRLSVPQVTINAYGTGPKPILDASDVIPAAAFRQTPDQAHLYQATVSPTFENTSVWVNVWENGKFLPRATDINQCNIIPNTCFVSSDTVAPVTIYIHSADGSNPAKNQKVYEFSSRPYGIDLYTSEHSTIKGLQTQKNVCNNGSTILGHFGTAIDCAFVDGSKHNVFGSPGVSFINCLAKNHYYNEDSTMFVYYEATPQLEPITFTGCTASNDTYDANCTGFFGHSFNGPFGEIHYTNCTVIMCGTGFIDNYGTSMLYENCHVEEAVSAWTFYNSNLPYSLRKCSVKDCQIAIDIRIDEVMLTVSELQVCASRGQTDSAGLVQIPFNKCDLTFEQCVFATTVPGHIFYATGTGLLALHVKNSQFIGAASNYHLIGPQATLISDNNCFQGSGTFIIGAYVYATLAAFQAATGQDVHSTVGNCSGGCA